MTGQSIFIADPIQGLQIISMGNLSETKTWQFPFLLEDNFISISTETDDRVYPRQGILKDKANACVTDLLLKGEVPHFAEAIPQSSQVAICAGKKLVIFNQMTKTTDQIFELPHRVDAMTCDTSEITLVSQSDLMQFRPTIQNNESLYEMVTNAAL